MGGQQDNIRAVLFDFGDTLFNFGPVNTARLFDQSARASYDYLRENNQPVGSWFIYRIRSLVSLRLHYWLANLTGRDFDSLKLLKKTGARGNFTLSDQQWLDLAWLWYEPLARLGKPEPNLREILGRLADMELKLGIVSNTFVAADSMDRHLREMGVLDFFPVRIYSYQLPFRKPDSRIFQTAAERIGEKPRNIVYVGDRICVDAKASAAAGMHAVLKAAYNNAGKAVPEGIHTIRALCELPPLIKKINNLQYEGACL